MYQQEKALVGDIQLVYLHWQGVKQDDWKKENILLLHGMADNSLVWLKLGEFLASKYNNYDIVAPDLRGHGNSSKPETGYFTHNYLQDILGLLQHLHWEKVHIIAHSWSAKIACIFATKFPNYCKSLTLVDPFFINSMPSVFRITFPLLYKVLPFLKLMQTFPDYQSAEKVAKTLNQYRGWSEWQREIFRYNMEEGNEGTWKSKFPKQARNEIFEDVLKQRGLTTELNIPSLLILPEKGLNRTPWQINPYRQYLTNLTIKKVPGNHWAFITEAEAFNKTIEEFLQSV